MICITGSSWISRNSWSAWNQGSQSECFCPNWIYVNSWYQGVCLFLACPNCTIALFFLSRVIQVWMVRKEKLELLDPRCIFIVLSTCPSWMNEWMNWLENIICFFVFLNRVRLVPQEKTVLLGPWWVALHLTASTWKKITCCLSSHIWPGNNSIMSSTSLMQGPRGLPGERGRPGPSGVAVSDTFIKHRQILYLAQEAGPG